MIKLSLADGKYTVIRNDGMTVFKALRYDEKWRDLCGDGLILSLVSRIEDLEEDLAEKEQIIYELQD